MWRGGDSVLWGEVEGGVIVYCGLMWRGGIVYEYCGVNWRGGGGGCCIIVVSWLPNVSIRSIILGKLLLDINLSVRYWSYYSFPLMHVSVLYACRVERNYVFLC